jgi:hypothetical protein
VPVALVGLRVQATIGAREIVISHERREVGRHPRLQGRYQTAARLDHYLELVHTPIHASWLNQAEIYLSVVQRKVLQPNEFAELALLEERLLAFGRHYEQIAKPFQWKFTRHDLNRLLDRLDQPNTATQALRAA